MHIEKCNYYRTIDVTMYTACTLARRAISKRGKVQCLHRRPKRYPNRRLEPVTRFVGLYCRSNDLGAFRNTSWGSRHVMTAYSPGKAADRWDVCLERMLLWSCARHTVRGPCDRVRTYVSCMRIINSVRVV